MDDDDDVFIPESDAEFSAFVEKFLAAVSPDPEKYGLTQADVTALRESRDAWVKSYEQHLASQEALRVSEQRLAASAAARAALTTKGGKDSDLFPPVAWMPHAPRGHRSQAPTGPRSRPIGRVEVYGPLAILIRFADERTPESNAVPEGIRCCEIRAYVGEQAPSDPARYTLRAQVSRPPYLDQYDPEDEGKRVFYILRWQDSGLAFGPWSAVVTATVPGA